MVIDTAAPPLTPAQDELLHLVLSGNGVMPIHRIASSPEEAAKVAVMMLAQTAALKAGAILYVFPNAAVSPQIQAVIMEFCRRPRP